MIVYAAARTVIVPSGSVVYVDGRSYPPPARCAVCRPATDGRCLVCGLAAKDAAVRAALEP
jgi:hypothetical protein